MRTFVNKIARSEEGITLPLTIIVVSLLALLSAVAAGAAVMGDKQSLRDRKVKRALGAADAGINLATYRINKMTPAVTPGTECVVTNGAGQLTTEAVTADGWCREQSEDLSNGASFRYRMSGRISTTVNGKSAWAQTIVSTGSVNGIQRRLRTSLVAPAGDELFSLQFAVFSQNDLLVENTAGVIGSAASNGNIQLENSAELCGDVFPGPNMQLVQGSGQNHQCPGYVNDPFDQSVVLPDVDVPDANDNARFGNLDPWTRPNKIEWDPATRVLDMSAQASMTLTGGTYVFCSLTMTENAQLIVPNDGTPVRIFIDAPENCGGASGSVTFTSNSRIENVSHDPSMVQLYVRGSSSTVTTAGFYNQHDGWMTVYAPRSNVIFDNPATLTGAVVGGQVTMQNASHIAWDSRAGNIDLSVLPIPRRVNWDECPSYSDPAAAPDAGC